MHLKNQTMLLHFLSQKEDAEIKSKIRVLINQYLCFCNMHIGTRIQNFRFFFVVVVFTVAFDEC